MVSTWIKSMSSQLVGIIQMVITSSHTISPNTFTKMVENVIAVHAVNKQPKMLVLQGQWYHRLASDDMFIENGTTILTPN